MKTLFYTTTQHAKISENRFMFVGRLENHLNTFILLKFNQHLFYVTRRTNKNIQSKVNVKKSIFVIKFQRLK